MRYIANAFSLQMLSLEKAQTIEVTPVDNFPADCVSAVGHTDTARVLGVECNRINIELTESDELYVAQVVGGRLPEGATQLPEGVQIKIVRVRIMS